MLEVQREIYSSPQGILTHHSPANLSLEQMQFRSSSKDGAAGINPRAEGGLTSKMTSSHSAPKSWITVGATPPQNEVW